MVKDRNDVTATDMWNAMQSLFSVNHTSNTSDVENRGGSEKNTPNSRQRRADKRKQHFADQRAKKKKTRSPSRTSTSSTQHTKHTSTPSVSAPQGAVQSGFSKLSFGAQPREFEPSSLGLKSYTDSKRHGLFGGHPLGRQESLHPVNFGNLQAVTSPTVHKQPRSRRSGLQKSIARKTATLQFRFQGYEIRHHPLTRLMTQVHIVIKDPSGGPAASICPEQLKKLSSEILNGPRYVMGGPGFSKQHGQEQVMALNIPQRASPVVLRSSEFQLGPTSDAHSNLPPFSDLQALFFWTKVQLLDKTSHRLILREFSLFLARDASFQLLLSFVSHLKPSSRRTYTSAIRMFIRGLQEVYPAFEQLHPFTLLARIREGKVTRAHVQAVLTYRMFKDQIDVSTFNVTVAAIKFAWRQACQEELVRSNDVVLSSAISALRKSFDSTPQGGDVFTQTELAAFYEIATELASNLQEELWALTLPWVSRFMLRRSEIIALEREHVHIHEEHLDFTPQEMITVELTQNKSYMYRRQSVSYFLCESSGPYDPRQLCERIAQCHKRGSKSSWFASTTARLSERNYFKFFNRCVAQFKARFPKYAKRRFVFHSLRASEIVELFNRGVHVDIIRQKARHSHWSTTFGSYASKALRFSRPPHL